MPKVSYDSRAVLIDGQRTLLTSGAIHYPRSTPEMWPDLLDLSQEAGLNCIETYVMWEGHEHTRGKYDFTGRFDLPRFLELCHGRGLHVILRMGPYICAEWNFGGFPPWLIDVPGIQIRTYNEPFMREVRQWLKVLVARVGDYQATRGGPIILAQVENEYKLVAKRYGADGPKYLQWMTEVAREVGIDVPLIMCEGAAPDAIETLNDFTNHHRVESMQKKRPNQPILWTELWPGWYDVWGCRHHLRDPGEIAYSVLRFFAAGGTGVNYYMWHGGTNFGRSAMYLQTTSYDFNAPIDEYGMPTTKMNVLGRVNRALQEHARVLLDGERHASTIIREGDDVPEVAIERWTLGDRSLAFLINGGNQNEAIEYGGESHSLPPKSVLMLAEEAGKTEVACRSWQDEEIEVIERKMEPVDLELEWGMIEDPAHYPQSKSQLAPKPESQLGLTNDDTDYCWHFCVFEAEKAREAELEIRGCGDVLYVFANSLTPAVSALPLIQNRGKFDGPAFSQRFTVQVAEGKNRLAILSVAMGLIKGDWMIDDSMEQERKGIWGEVLLDGKPIETNWVMTSGLGGEALRFWDPNPSEVVPWKPLGESNNPLRWYRTRFGVKAEALLEPAPWALDMTGMGKGYIWVNGHCLGRYWQVAGRNEATDHLNNPLIQLAPAGELTQRYYHIPRSWLLDTMNYVVILEEQRAVPTDVCLVRRR